MKHKLLILLSLIMLMPLNITAQDAPHHRVVYLWDVTYSMYGGLQKKPKSSYTHTMDVAKKSVTIEGYDEKYDIYDEIMKMLIRHMQEYGDTTEIIIVPFTDNVLERNVMRELATQEGKQRLEEMIRAFRHVEQEYTNIKDPFDFATTLFDGSKYPKAKNRSELYILTDGVHNVDDPEKRFYPMLKTWCEKVAYKYNVEGFYFLLTDKAFNKKLIEILNDENLCGCIHVVNYYEKHYYSIIGNQLINIKDQYEAPVLLRVEMHDSNKPISGNEKLQIVAEDNPYLKLDTVVTITGACEIELHPHYLPLSKLQEMMPTDVNTTITINFEQLQVNDRHVNVLTNHSCTLDFVNKAQKTLLIKIK